LDCSTNWTWQPTSITCTASRSRCIAFRMHRCSAMHLLAEPRSPTFCHSGTRCSLTSMSAPPSAGVTGPGHVSRLLRPAAAAALPACTSLETFYGWIGVRAIPFFPRSASLLGRMLHAASCICFLSQDRDRDAPARTSVRPSYLALPAGAAGLRVPVWCRFESRIDVVPPALVAEPETLPQYQQCSLGRIGLSRLLGDTFLESGGVCVGNDCEHHSAGSVSP
jgi:hypothetical protein